MKNALLALANTAFLILTVINLVGFAFGILDGQVNEKCKRETHTRIGRAAVLYYVGCWLTEPVIGK